MSNVWTVDAVDHLAVAPAVAPAESLPEDFSAYAIAGRCLTASGDDIPCRAIKMSTTHAAIVGARRVEAGEIVVCHLDNVGMLRGCVTRPLADGFIMQLDVAETRKPAVRAALQWHAERASDLADMRAAPRIVPVSRVVDIWLGAALVFRGLILNISVSGAAIVMKPAERPFQGAPVRAGRRMARVVRLIEKGVAVQFDEPFDPATFDRNVVL